MATRTLRLLTAKRLNVRDKGSLGGFLGPLFSTRGRLQIEGEAGAGIGGSVTTYWSF